jgi:hypothetical protein
VVQLPFLSQIVTMHPLVEQTPLPSVCGVAVCAGRLCDMAEAGNVDADTASAVAMNPTKKSFMEDSLSTMAESRQTVRLAILSRFPVSAQEVLPLLIGWQPVVSQRWKVHGEVLPPPWQVITVQPPLSQLTEFIGCTETW